MNYWTQSAKNIYVAAHRGWCAAYPENTMEAFRAAAELGVDQIETDVRVTKDGQLVLMHDATVDRTTDGSGRVCDQTLAELRALNARAQNGEAGKKYTIPTLVEFLEYAKDVPGLTIDLELKEYPTAGWEAVAYSVCDRVLELVDQYGLADRCVMNSFSGKLNEYIWRRHGKKYRQHVFFPLHCLGECTIDPYSYAYCCCMFGATREDYAAMTARGVQPWAGASVRDEVTLNEAIACGAHLITCNNPDLILKLLREKGYHAK